MTFEEALRIAELQAVQLQEMLGADVGVLESDIASLPHIAVRYEYLTVSGMSHWNGSEWIIVLNRTDSWVRQRFTLLHEFKHIVDHGHTSILYTGDLRLSAKDRAERAADFFAGCALVPRRQLKAAWGHGIQRFSELSAYFGVSENAIAVRLSQTGLSTAVDKDPAQRCVQPGHSDQEVSPSVKVADRTSQRKRTE